MENLAWSSDRILNTCEDNLLDKVRYLLVGVSPQEGGVPLVLKIMLEIFMNVDDSALRFLTQNLQTIHLKDIPGENVSTIMSYLKGALLLLENFSSLPTYIMGLLNDMMCSAENEEFSRFMRFIYFDHKRKTNVVIHATYLQLTEAGYRTLYRYQKWLAAKSDLGSGFFVGEQPELEGVYNADDGGHNYGGRGGGRYAGGRGRDYGDGRVGCVQNGHGGRR